MKLMSVISFLFQSMWDVRSRVLNLSSLGLFPKLFGQDVTKVFKQKYYGECSVTLVLSILFTDTHFSLREHIRKPDVCTKVHYNANLWFESISEPDCS